jgi:uncharacterized protein (UPF0128 family)
VLTDGTVLFIMTKHYVEFYYPGSFFPETSVKEIKSRKEKIETPKGCYGYMFFDQEEIESNGETLIGKPKNKSGMTYFGKKYSIEDLKREFPENRILISNIEGNGYKFAVKTIRGNWQPVDKKDKVVDAS